METQTQRRIPKAVEPPKTGDGAHPRRRRWLTGAVHSLTVERGLVFAGATALVVWMALRGGSYDLVVRQEVALAVWLLLALGFAAGALPRSRPPAGLALAAGALLVLILLTGLSLRWTASDERTANELIRLVGYAGLVTLAWAGVSRETWRAGAAGLAVGAITVCAIALGSRLFPEGFPEDRVARVFDTERLSYPFDYWNAVGVWAAMSTGIALAWSAHARFAPFRAAALAAVPLCGLTAYLTYSRGAVIGAAIALVATLCLSRNRWTALAHALAAAGATAGLILAVRDEPQIATGSGGDGGGRIALLLLAAAGACAAIALLSRYAHVDRFRLPARWAAVATPLLLIVVLGAGIGVGGSAASREWERFRGGEPVSSGAGEDPAARLVSGGGNRSSYWESTFDAFDTDELRGLGAGTFELWWAQHPRASEFIRDAHSVYFEQFAELGVPGFSALVCFLAGLLWMGLRPRFLASVRSYAVVPMLVAFVVYLFGAGVDWFWEYPSITGLALVAVCLAGAAGSRSRSALRLPLRLGLVGLALLAAAAQIPGIVGTERTRASATALSEGSPREAARLAGEAIDAQPWSASAYGQRALAELAAADLGAARRDARAARDRDPKDYRYLLTLSEIELRAEAPARAARHFREASLLRRSSRTLPESQAYTLSLFRRIIAAQQARRR